MRHSHNTIEEASMNARRKLNIANLNGAVLIGAVLGAIADSWTVVLLTVAAIVASDIYTGQIRPTDRRQKSLRR